MAALRSLDAKEYFKLTFSVLIFAKQNVEWCQVKKSGNE